MIWDPIDRLLWGIVITTFFIAGLLYLRNSRKRDSFNEKILLYGFTGFFFTLTVYRILYYIAEIMIQGTYRNNVMYGEFRNDSVILVKFIMITYIVAFMIYFLSIEILNQRTGLFIKSRFLITLMNIIFIILIIVSSLDLARSILALIFYPFILLMLFINIFYLTKWSKFEFKAISSLLFLGLCLILVGISLTDPLVKSANILPLYIPPLMVIVGTIIAISPLLINHKILYRAMMFWKISVFLISGIFIFFSVYAIIFQFPISVIILMVFIDLMIIIVSYKIVKMIKIETSAKINDKNGKLNILGVFTKPLRVTEDEISISKEKKICLVCKNKLKGYIFICEFCETFYCEKCIDAVIQIENFCWACNNQIDKSKPVKPLKKSEAITDDKVKGSN